MRWVNDRAGAGQAQFKLSKRAFSGGRYASPQRRPNGQHKVFHTRGVASRFTGCGVVPQQTIGACCSLSRGVRSGKDVMHYTQIAANGLGIHVATAGPSHAPLVVLLHGFPETSLAWRRYVDPLLAMGWRVAIPDQRGYGRSDKPQRVADYELDTLADDVLAMGSALNAEQFSVIGHDWGGMVAWHLAARHPEAVERLVILNAPHPASFFGYALTHPFQLARSAYVGLFQLPLVPEALLRSNDCSLLAASLTWTSNPGTFDEELLSAYREAWQAPRAMSSMLNWYRAMATARPISTRIEAPTLILWGDRDAALEAGLADEALSYCARGRLERLADSTHWLHHEQPVRVSALLCDFLAQHAGAGAAA